MVPYFFFENSHKIFISMDCNFDVYIAFLFVSDIPFHKRNIIERLSDL